MRLLVCGDRNWTDRNYLYNILGYYRSVSLREGSPLEIIEGEAIGADEMAGDWAQEQDVPIITRNPWIEIRPNKLCSKAVNNGQQRGFPALWNEYGRSAGPIRNGEMLKVGKPDKVIAFHNDITNSHGTKHMVDLASRAKIPTQVYAPDALIQQSDLGFIK